jgi:flagellar FliL protein
MASNEVAVEVTSKPVGSEQASPLLPMLIAVVAAMVVVLLAAAGAGFWLLKSGKLAAAPVAAKVAPAESEEAATKVSSVPLEPLLVNLADADKRSYLRISVTLRIEDRPVGKAAAATEEKPAKGKPVNKFEAEEQDALLGVLGRQTADDLLSPDGKDRLKLQMLSALRNHVPGVSFKDVLFTEFLVQR